MIPGGVFQSIVQERNAKTTEGKNPRVELVETCGHHSFHRNLSLRGIFF